MRKRAMALVWIAALAVAAPAMAETNFAGSWILNLSKSDFGKFPAPEIMMRTVTQKTGEVAWSTYQKGQQGEVTTKLQYPTNGKQAVNGDYHGTAMWQGDKLVIESARTMPVQGQPQAKTTESVELKQREEWSLSADGKTMTVQTRIMLPQGAFDVKQTFEKAPEIPR